MPSGHKAFLVNNPSDVDLLLMHNRTYAAEYVVAGEPQRQGSSADTDPESLTQYRRGSVLTLLRGQNSWGSRLRMQRRESRPSHEAIPQASGRNQSNQYLLATGSRLATRPLFV